MKSIDWSLWQVFPWLVGFMSLGCMNAIALEPAPATPPSSSNNLDRTHSTPLLAQHPPEIEESLSTTDSMSQVTSVSQLRDVQPTDWAFQALQNLVERYGCIAGYPDGTFRGNRAMTRYEFAAGLNACLEQIRAIIGDGEAIDLSTIERLQAEFAAELATLRGRVDALEVRTAELEANQFSTTTQLNGEVVFALSDGFREPNFNGEDEEIAAVPTFGYRARLNFDTSFTGRDRLRTRLQARDIPDYSDVENGSAMARLGFDGDTDGEFEIDEFWYRFPLSEQLSVHIDAMNGDFNDSVEIFSPLSSSGRGAISRFGRYNPIYRQGDGPGITLNFALNDAITISAGYLAEDGNDPRQKRGLVNGSYAALGQIAFQPSDNLGFALTYVNSYNPGFGVNLTGSTGSRLARQPFGEVATSANHFGAQGSIRILPRFTLAGWAGYTQAHAEIRGIDDNNDAEIFNWAVSLAAELGPEGSLAGLIVGQPPRVTDNDLGGEDPDTATHIEAFYRYQLNDSIAITPGLLFIDNPEHDSDRTSILIGTVRTTFRF